MLDLTISIVIYNNQKEQIVRILECLKKTQLSLKLYIIDNSENNRLISLTELFELEYIFNDENLGFGAAHNMALKDVMEKSKYHLVLNPDIYFKDDTLEGIFHWMESHPDVGILMPKILYPDGSIQYLPKLLPSPFDIIRRKIMVSKSRKNRWINNYELRDYSSDRTFEAPIISGCFTFIRINILKHIGIYDERYFMYFEDFDFSRRVHKGYKTVYYADASVYHEYERGAQKSLRLFMIFIKSAIEYFNKWGWIFDKERDSINVNTLEKFLS